MASEKQMEIPGFETPGAYASARNMLTQTGYTERGIAKLFKGKDPTAPRQVEMPELLRSVAGDSPLETLACLFLLGLPVEVPTARRAFKPMELEQWVKAGLVNLQGGDVIAALRIVPYKEFLMGIETAEARQAHHANFVLGISRSSQSLVNFTVRRRSRDVLDIGTGCGIQAILAAGLSKKVYATDVNPRAIQFGRFNAGLNGLHNIEFLKGSLYEPVQGKKFDLILSNPPFVISPESGHAYLDSGMESDRFAQKLVSKAPEHLAEGGYFQMIFNWAHISGHKWQDRLRKWVAGTGCDTWVILRLTRNRSAYAMNWINDNYPSGGMTERYDQWMAYFKQEGIRGVSTGFLFMRRRREAKNWFRADEWKEAMQHPVGDDILRGFAAQDFLEKMSRDQDLINARLTAAPGVRLEQQSKPSGGGWQVVSARLRKVEGLTYTHAVNPPVANLIARCDGQRPLKELLSALAASQKKTLDSILPAYLGVVRQLIARGLLLPPGKD